MNIIIFIVVQLSTSFTFFSPSKSTFHRSFTSPCLHSKKNNKSELLKKRKQRKNAEQAVQVPPTKTIDVTKAQDLPDFKDAVTRKMKQKQEEPKSESPSTFAPATPTPKIKRNNIKDFNNLLEIDPSADMNDEYFQPRKYNTVSALLGEQAKPFLGIPLAVLQIGHFFGLLTILLMSFVEYPGFPLTDLPTAVRETLKSGVSVVLLVNFLLALSTKFLVDSRGQSFILFFSKTLVVGGLAFDQLLQLPKIKTKN